MSEREVPQEDSTIYSEAESDEKIDTALEIVGAMAYRRPRPEAHTKWLKSFDFRIMQLNHIIFRGGAERGYGSWIGRNLQALQVLQCECPSTDFYWETIEKIPNWNLHEMFPGWCDRDNLQAKYEAMDVGCPIRAVYDAVQQSRRRYY